MNWWNWFFAAFLGALLAEALSLLSIGLKDLVSVRQSKITILINYIDEYSNLVDLYRLYAHSSHRLVHPNNEPIDENNISETISEDIVLEPENRDLEIISLINNMSLEQLIDKSIIDIKNKQTKNLIIADEIDSSGNLRKKFTELYVVSIWEIQTFLKHKDKGDPHKQFNLYVDKLSKAVDFQKKLKLDVRKFNKIIRITRK